MPRKPTDGTTDSARRDLRKSPKRRRGPAAGAENEVGAGPLHRATIRLLQILEYLATDPLRGFTLTEFSRALQIPKSSLLSILRTLTEQSFLEITPAGEYRLAPKAIGISRDVWLKSAIHSSLVDLAHPHLVELEQKIGETAFLGIPGNAGTDIVYVDQVESSQMIRYGGGLGEHRPLYCTAIGLAYLASLPAERLDDYIETVNLIPLTPRTISRRDVLQMRIDEVRRSGVAISIEEFVAGASGVGAAIFGRNGVPAGACSVSGPTDRILAQRERIAQAVKATAAAISSMLGYVPRAAERGTPERAASS